MRTKKILPIIFFVIFCSCSNSENANSNTAAENKIELSDTGKILLPDTAAVIKRVDSLSNSIEKMLPSYEKEDITVMGFSAEGTALTIYYDNGEVKKLLAEHAGETGKATEELFFENQKLFLTVRKEYQYEKPIYENSNPKIISQQEEHFYLSAGNLIKWTKGNSYVKKEGDNYNQRTQQLINSSEEYLNKIPRH